MAKGCDCDDPNLVTLYDRNMAQTFHGGNPYSRFCTNCRRRYFCAARYWERADQKYVIPEGESEPVPVEEWDGNFFECPKCGKPHMGFPSDCECGVEYDWDAVAAEA